MEGLVRGERRQAEITEVYYGAHVRPPMDGISLISEADWTQEDDLTSYDHSNHENGSHHENGGNSHHSRHHSHHHHRHDYPHHYRHHEDDTRSHANETTGLLGAPKRRFSDCASCCEEPKTTATSFLAEIPAILVSLLINFMAAIPFGVSYFPLGWSNHYDNDNDNDDSSGGGAAAAADSDGIRGPFPLPGKEALGIRMFLLACITGQLTLAIFSKFRSPMSSQLIENVPFYHALASIVIAEQGYGPEALSTLFFLFGLGSVTTGLMFFGLGKAGLGKALHYFPSHVLIGFIGGIGVFVAVSSVGVLTGEEFEFTAESVTTLVGNFGQMAPALAFEIVLRILMLVLVDPKTGKPLFGLLGPFYFLSIVPMFYIGLYLCGITIDEATTRGYFFPSEETTQQPAASKEISLWETILNSEVLDIFKVIDLRTISWTAVLKSSGTVLGVSCFSVINVPINIPAFANTCNVEVDMNNELLAHGYSNLLAGLLGGIQNVMTYSFSVLFYKSGGHSKAAHIVYTALLVGIFVYGVAIIPYIPKCMAGTLLLHIGVDLFIEGVCDSFHEYDRIEYGGIIVITVVMNSLGMTSALIAGIVVAMTTYALQSAQHLDPIFNITTAQTLRSSAWTRPPDAMAVLDSSSTGRARILVIQLQGNLFFGNAVDMTDAIKEALATERPRVVILDFTLVVGMDTSAAQSVNKIKNVMNQTFGVATNIFVMGPRRGYFPCEYGLTRAILEEDEPESNKATKTGGGPRKFLIPKNQLCVDFDEALVFAEDILISFVDPKILTKESLIKHYLEQKSNEGLTLDEEKDLATYYLQNLIRPDPFSNENRDAVRFLSYFQRESYSKSQAVWRHGDQSDSAKLVLSGTLVASLPNGFREEIPRGCFIGELGLIEGVDRLSEVVCESERAVLYSLNRETWEQLVRDDPALARILDHITIRYLSHRVQHVSNRIYETRCLPV